MRKKERKKRSVRYEISKTKETKKERKKILNK